MLESGIQDIFYVGIRNPVSWNPESTKVLESGIYLCRNPLVSNCLGRFFHFSTQSPFSSLPLTLLHLQHSKHVFELVHAGHNPPREGGYFPHDVSFKVHATKKMPKIRSLTLSSACIGSFFEVYQVEPSGF